MKIAAQPSAEITSINGEFHRQTNVTFLSYQQRMQPVGPLSDFCKNNRQIEFLRRQEPAEVPPAPLSPTTADLRGELKGPAESHQSQGRCQVRRNTFTHLQSDSSRLAANPVSPLTPVGQASWEEPAEAGAFS